MVGHALLKQLLHEVPDRALALVVSLLKGLALDFQALDLLVKDRYDLALARPLLTGMNRDRLHQRGTALWQSARRSAASGLSTGPFDTRTCQPVPVPRCGERCFSLEIV